MCKRNRCCYNLLREKALQGTGYSRELGVALRVILVAVQVFQKKPSSSPIFGGP